MGWAPQSIARRVAVDLRTGTAQLCWMCVGALSGGMTSCQRGRDPIALVGRAILPLGPLVSSKRAGR